MNPLDLVAIVLVLLALVLGFRSGALPQVGGLLGAVGGGAVAILALPALADPLDSLDPAWRPIVVLAGLLLAVGIGESIGSALGRAIANGMGTGMLGAADRVSGAFLGAGQALLIIWLVGGLLALGSISRLTEAAQTSATIRTLNSVLPPPEDIAAELGTLLDASGLPDVFVGFEPLPRPPVDRPDDETTNVIAQAAESSTVQVRAATCGLESSGTGVIIGEGYVVTNAHVVAGAGRRGIRVAALGEPLADAVVVLFDPDLDVALLHADDLDARPLRLATKDPDRGTIGAALGYPGGGSLTIVPAAVTGAYSAIGRDIYGEGRVRRDILELRAEVEQGDSGGPFVLEDGTVGGLIFAEARTDDQVGYALSPNSVADAIEPALGRTESVATGECLH